MKVEVIEIPTFLGEAQLAKLILADPKILGDDVEVIKHEFTLPTKKSIDILAKSGDEFLIVELKTLHGDKKYVLRGGIEQLKGYLKGFTRLASIFGVKPRVKLVLVLAVSVEEKAKRYSLDLKTGKIGRVQYKLGSSVLEKVKSEVMRELKRSTRYHLRAQLEKEIEELKARVEPLRNEVNRLTNAKKAKLGRVGDRFLYILPRFIDMKEDLCFVCGKRSDIIFKIGNRGKPFGLCIKHYEAICKIEEEVEIPSLKSDI